MSWVPPNISDVCAEASAPLTSCSPAGYMFLALVTQLFGNSVDRPQSPAPQFSPSPYPSAGSNEFVGPPIVIPTSLRIPQFSSFSGQQTSGPSSTGIRPPSIQDVTSPFGLSGIGIGPTGPLPTTGISNLKDNFLRPALTTPVLDHQFNSVHDPATINAYSHGIGGSRGVSKTSFYVKKTPTTPEINYSFETKVGENSFLKLKPKAAQKPFDFSFLKKEYNEGSGYLKTIDQNLQRVQQEVDRNIFYEPQSFGVGEYTSASENKQTKVPIEQPPKSEKKRSKRQVRAEEYDFIVVGAGSAGCVIANRLSEVKAWKVLLLEAGEEEPEVASVPALASVLAQSSIDWRYRTQPEQYSCRAQRGGTCAWLRGKVMGGSSTINYMVYMRGNKRDYDEWAEAGNHGWSYRDVLPYFKKSENNRDIEGQDTRYHGVGGYLNVERFPYFDKNVIMIVDSFKEKGLPLTDFNAEQQIGTMTVQSTSMGGKRYSTNVAFIRPIRNKRPNLKIRTHSEVTKVLIDPHTKTAYGVKYFQLGQWHYAYARKEVVVSAGALNSPKILMLSGIGPAHQLRNLNIVVAADLKVGSNLQDHATTDALVFAVSNKTSTFISPNQLSQELYYYNSATVKNGPLSATGPLSASAFIKTEYSAEGPDTPDIQFHFDGRNLADFYSDPTTYLASNVLPVAFYNALATRPILLKPKSRGYVLLNTTDPVFGPPLIYSGIYTSKVDVDTMIAAIRFAVSLEGTDAFKVNGASYVRYPVQACSGFAWGTDEYFACILMAYTSTIYHPVGTCKMGPHWDRDAVVDPRLRVYGVKNLRVADASIMPTIVRGNTNAPCIMIGEKVSDMIKADWINH